MTDTNVDHIVVYRSTDSEFRWRAVAGNGEIVSEGESHPRSEDASRAAKGVFGQDVEIVEEVEADGSA
jgi:uncharacterized protein YegP (UPF0339 family)